jgi:hypothetical protein
VERKSDRLKNQVLHIFSTAWFFGQFDFLDFLIFWTVKNSQKMIFLPNRFSIFRTVLIFWTNKFFELRVSQKKILKFSILMDFLVQKINRSKKSKQPKKSRIFWAKISFFGNFLLSRKSRSPKNQIVQKIKQY